MALQAVVVAGVAGAGKTTVGRALAARLGWDFVDADDHHPAANVAKMAAGNPLTEDDRAPWLAALHDLLATRLAAGHRLVMACSALRVRHRRSLSEGDPRIGFAVLTAEPELLQARLASRSGHFMPASLLASQLETQEWSPEAVPFDAGEPVEELLQRIAWWSASELAAPLPTSPVDRPLLRWAGQDDADQVAELHLRAWRRAYPGLAPQAAYQVLDLSARQLSWRGMLGGSDHGRFTLLAEVGERLVGFCHAGLGSDPPDPVFGSHARVKYLYLDPRCIGRGLGGRLLSAAAAALRERGARSLALGVVTGNGPAIAFYRHKGATVAGSFIDPGPVWRSRNLLCLWEDIGDLASAGHPVADTVVGARTAGGA